MEDSRKGKRDEEKGLSTPNPHVDGGNGKKAIVYNTKEEKKEWRRKKKKNKKNIREKKKEKTIRMVYSQIIALEHIRGYFLYKYTCITLSF